MQVCSLKCIPAMLGITALGVLMGCSKIVLLFTHPAKPCTPLYSNQLHHKTAPTLQHSLFIIIQTRFIIGTDILLKNNIQNLWSRMCQCVLDGGNF